MSKISAGFHPPYRRQIQQIAATLSEGVILIDVDQTIKWANAAALAMHGVDRPEALGGTIDEYHANFQVRFRNSHSTTSQHSVESVAAGEAFRDVIVEVTPLGGDKPVWLRRVRNLVLTDEGGTPACIVLVLHAVNEDLEVKGRFASSIDRTPYPAVIMRVRDQVFLDANEAFLTLTGYAKAEVIDHPLSEIDFLHGCAAGEEALRSVANSTSLPLVQSIVPLADGAAKPILLAGQPIDFCDQRCMLFTLIDVSPARQEADAIRTGAGAVWKDAAALCAAAPVPLHVLDADMHILDVSEAWLQWLGYRREAVIGHGIAEFMAAPYAAHFLGHAVDVLHNTGALQNMECQFVKKSGEIAEALVSVSARRDANGVLLGAVGASTDITERKHSEECFTKAFSLSPVPMMIRKLDDPRILDANDAFLSATGHAAHAVVGHSLDEMGLFETRALRQQFENQLRTDGRMRNMDVRARTASGDVLDCVLSAERVHAFGQPCVLLALQDVTERRRNEVQLFQAIEAVMKDTSWFSRTVIEKLAGVRSPNSAHGPVAEINDLTRREREVLGLISHGMTDTDIAQKLGLTRSTVRNHVATLYSKIGVHSRSSAIVWARERGVNIAWPRAVATADQIRRRASL
jgi:PAS domain S-box-containing protein